MADKLLVDVVRDLIKPFGKTLDDVDDVQLDNDERPTKGFIFFKDGSIAELDINLP